MAGKIELGIIADENIPLQTVRALRAAGSDVVWIRTDGPGTPDVLVMEQAEAQGRLLLTLDRDYLQLVSQRRAPLAAGGVIVLRVHPATHASVTSLALSAISAIGEIWKGRAFLATTQGMYLVPRAR